MSRFSKGKKALRHVSTECTQLVNHVLIIKFIGISGNLKSNPHGAKHVLSLIFQIYHIQCKLPPGKYTKFSMIV